MYKEKYGDNAILVDNKYIGSDEYRKKYIGITGNTGIDGVLADTAIEILKDRSGTLKETLVLINKNTGDKVLTIAGDEENQRIKYEPEHEKIIREAKETGAEIISIHNHPTGWPPTADDCVSANLRGYNMGITCGHNGSVYVYEPSELLFDKSECDDIHNMIAYESIAESDIRKVLSIWKDILSDYGMTIRERR